MLPIWKVLVDVTLISSGTLERNQILRLVIFSLLFKLWKMQRLYLGWKSITCERCFHKTTPHRTSHKRKRHCAIHWFVCRAVVLYIFAQLTEAKMTAVTWGCTLEQGRPCYDYGDSVQCWQHVFPLCCFFFCLKTGDYSWTSLENGFAFMLSGSDDSFTKATTTRLHFLPKIL